MIALLAALACTGPPPEPPPEQILAIGWPTDVGSFLSPTLVSAQDDALVATLATPAVDWDFDCRLTPDLDGIIDRTLSAGGERYGRRAGGTITPELCDA